MECPLTHVSGDKLSSYEDIHKVFIIAYLCNSAICNISHLLQIV